MNDCKRFENEGLLALERGEPLDTHFSQCEICIEERRKYDSLKTQLSQSTPHKSPSKGWEEKVFEQIQTEAKEQNKDNKRWWPALAASLVGLSVIAISIFQSRSPYTDTYVQTLVKGAKVYRNDSASIGDTIQIASTMSDARYIYINIYRNDRLFFSCSSDSKNTERCDYDSDKSKLSTMIELTAIGNYQPIVISGKQPINFTFSDLDSDASRARNITQTSVKLGNLVSVK